MGIFRKKETYNEQMLREAGLDRVVFNAPQPEPLPIAPVPPQFNTGDISLGHGPGKRRYGPMDWDITTTATAPGVDGDSVEFTTLPSGDLIVTEETGDGSLSPFADAIEEHISPPYKAIASRQDGDLWGIGAKRIEVATIPFPAAQALELTQSDGIAELRVDGEPSEATAPVELRRLGERIGGDFCVEAERIDGDHWEVRASPL
jgi:hypothetical protein